jgi:glycosyltransferase-like protein
VTGAGDPPGARQEDHRLRPSVGVFTYSTLPRGSVVHAAHLADALHAAGWDVTLYALDKDRRGFFRPLRARLCPVPAAGTPPTTAELVRIRAAELSAFLRDRPRPRVFHAEDCLTASGLLELGVPFVRTVHHVERFDDPFLDRCQERSIRHAARCLTVSRAAARDVQKIFGVDTHFVGNGVAVDRFHPVDALRADATRARLLASAPTAGPVLLAVGGVEERKNTLRILGAFTRVAARHPGAQLWILGGATVLDHGAYRAEFEHALGALAPALRTRVRELGVVPEDDVPVLFRLADVVTLPSLHEGFGLVALEALAAERPVVVADAPPFTEFLDDECATLVDPLSEEAIAAGILDALARDRRAAGLKVARRHSWAEVAARHAAVYREVGHA